MPGTVVGTSLNQGFPGSYARNGDCIIENRLVTPADATGPNFGSVVVAVQNATGGTFTDAAVAMAAGHTPVTTFGANYIIAGIAVRNVKSFTTFSPAPTVGNYAPGEPCDVILRGSVSVVVKDPQTAGYLAGAKVYLRTVLNGGFPSAAVGDLETAADGGNTVQLTNAVLGNGPFDANSVGELVLLTRAVS